MLDGGFRAWALRNKSDRRLVIEFTAALQPPRSNANQSSSCVQNLGSFKPTLEALIRDTPLYVPSHVLQTGKPHAFQRSWIFPIFLIEYKFEQGFELRHDRLSVSLSA